jgi:hypothetical protein
MCLIACPSSTVAIASNQEPTTISTACWFSVLHHFEYYRAVVDYYGVEWEKDWLTPGNASLKVIYRSLQLLLLPAIEI